MTYKKHLVAGFGDVGRAIYEILQKDPEYEVVAIDKGFNLKGRFDVLHICFPFSGEFTDWVHRYATEFGVSLIIIHSTVQVGTTRGINLFNAVHSPVRGRHPSMVRDMKSYVKYFSGERAKEAAEIFEKVGIRTKCFKNTETTELGKLLSNIRWGLNIAFAQEQKRMCDFYGVKYEDAVREFEHTRNVGLRAIDRPNARMPIVYPGFIGGHCVMPNVEILLATYSSRFLKAILESNVQYAEDRKVHKDLGTS